MLAKDPDDRPQTVAELGEDVEALSTEPAAPGARSLLGLEKKRTPTPKERPPTPRPVRARTPTPASTPAVSMARDLRARLLSWPRWAVGAAAGVAVLLLIAAVMVAGFLPGGGSSAAAPAPKGLAAVAGWGSSATPNHTDTAIRSTAHGVTVSNPFPDGSSTAQCFIQVTTKSGAQSDTFGHCGGVTLAVTCASGSYNLAKLAPSGTGAGLTIDGLHLWAGAYDQGTNPSCPNHPRGVADSLAAHLSGTAAGQNLVWLVGGDNLGHFGDPTSTQRSGCFAYIEAAGTSESRCVQTDFRKDVGSFYDEVAARGASGDLVETGSTGNLADVTLQGVFVEAPGASALLPDELRSPSGVGVDRQGNIYIADSGDNLVEKISPAGKPLMRWSEAGGKPFNNPQGVKVDAAGNIYVADQANNRVVKLSASGRSTAPWGRGDSGPNTLNAPIALAVDGAGNVWALDAGTPPLHELSPAGKMIKQASLGNISSELFSGIALDGHGHIDVTPGLSGGVSVFSIAALSGAYANVPVSGFGTYGGLRGQLRQPGEVALDAAGNIYVADTGNNRIAVLSASGKWLFAVGRKGTGNGGFNAPQGVAVDSRGNVYVADTNNDRIEKLTPQRRR
jgi:sugar lactone lactonase YvrE